jgi:hypothetical protein
MEPRCDDLFRWYVEHTIGDRQIWMRTLSALDDNERTREAMQHARKVRARLLILGSPERGALITALEGLDRADLLEIIRLYQTEATRGLAIREVHAEIDPPEPVEPTLEAALDAEDVWAAEQLALATRREEYIKDHVATYMKLQEDREYDELLELATDLEINAAATRAYMEELEYQTVFRACFKDKKMLKRWFESIAQVRDLASYVYQGLIAKYYELDRFATSAEALKN